MNQTGKATDRRLEIVVFFGGAIGMIVELVGSRVISPYFGNSLVVWTSLIGVVLGCLSAGYYYGGRLADRYPTYSGLSKVILMGAFSLGITSFLKEPILGAVQFAMGYELRAASFMAVLILFGPVSFSLGMIAPFAAKLRLSHVGSTGRVVGNLYAISTFGSIMGTFLAGFWLIPLFGNGNLLYGLTLALFLLSGLPVLKLDRVTGLSLILLAGLFYLNRIEGVLSLQNLADVDSLYNRIVVWQFLDDKYGPVTAMSTDNFAAQSAYIPGQPDELYLEYTKAFRTSWEIDPVIKKALLIGGGGYSFAIDFLNKHPGATMDVIEIDPQMTALAKIYFGLKELVGLKIFHGDARMQMSGPGDIYDVIYLDAFNSLTPPPHLTTREFMTDLMNHLSPKGFLMVNMIGSVEGKNSRFMKAERNTILTVFPKVEVYRVKSKSPEDVQSLLIIAYQNEDERKLSLGEPIGKFYGEKEILTDDWAPVEYMTRNYYRN